jgi:hypothetical protein
MKVSYDEDVANHIGSESCVYFRKGVGEALTGESAGWVLSRERGFASECRRRQLARKAKRATSLSQEVIRLRVVVGPMHARKLSAREPGGPTSGLEKMVSRSAQRIPREHGCDVRMWEVGQAHIYRRSYRTRVGANPACGGCGGKGPGQGESVSTKQVPDTVPGGTKHG